MIDKLILGTAGLSGAPYGVSGRIVSLPDSIAVISHALACGFTAIDTAPTYGHAEKAIGAAIRGRKVHAAPIPVVYTKTTGDESGALNSIQSIGVMPTFLWHNWQREPWPAWVSGGTFYSHDQGGWCYHPRGIFQCDWNILNQAADGLPCQLIARSVFLQGMLLEFKFGTRLEQEVWRAASVAESLGVTLPALALWAALNNPKISNVVVGCSSIDEVDTILRILEKPVWTSTAIKILHVGGPETDPRTWK